MATMSRSISVCAMETLRRKDLASDSWVPKSGKKLKEEKEVEEKEPITIYEEYVEDKKEKVKALKKSKEDPENEKMRMMSLMEKLDELAKQEELHEQNQQKKKEAFSMKVVQRDVGLPSENTNPPKAQTENKNTGSVEKKKKISKFKAARMKQRREGM